MPLFKLLAGQHIQADYDAPPQKTVARNAFTGADEVIEKYPSKKYNQGETVESDLDLVELFGAEKFRLIGESKKGRRGQPAPQSPLGPHTPGDPAPAVAQGGPANFPAGQASAGFQPATTAPEGRTASGPADADEAKPRGGQGDLYDQGDEDSLEDLTVEELRDLAADEEIPLHGASRKAEIVEAIRRGRRG